MIFFLIPAFNEEANLPGLLASLQHWTESRGENCHLVVVDDGSRDGTVRVLEQCCGLPLTLVRHGMNLGAHEAFRSAFAAWRRLPFQDNDWVVTLEADNTSSLEILQDMLSTARTGADVVLASCYAPGGQVVGTTFWRTFLSFCANLILRCTPGMPAVYTFSSFYRVHRASFLAQALDVYGPCLIEEKGFVCVVELLLKFGYLNASISEVPLRLDGAQRKGASKMKVARTIVGYFTLFAHAITGRLSRPEIPPEPVMNRASIQD